MQRRLEPVDVMVAVGLFATVLGGLGMFMAASGIVAAPFPDAIAAEGRFNGSSDPMQWVQPALGQAITDAVRLEQETFHRKIAAETDLQRAHQAEDQFHAGPSSLERILAHAGLVEADHRGRLQFVMGRRIVDATARNVKARTSRLPSPALNEQQNRRMIRSAELYALRQDSQYRLAHEPVLGEDILAATQAQQRLERAIQQRLGLAIVRVATVQAHNGQALAASQEQLATVTLAALRQDLMDERSAGLAEADARQVSQPVFFAGARDWPEIPMGLMVAFSFGLIGIFLIGVSTPSPRRETAAPADVVTESAHTPYRKTA